MLFLSNSASAVRHKGKSRNAQSRSRMRTVHDMKLETITMDEAQAANDFRICRGEQRLAGPIRLNLPSRYPRTGTSANRAYLRGLRAAEMTAWELSGGDYLLSDRACPPSWQ